MYSNPKLNKPSRIVKDFKIFNIQKFLGLFFTIWKFQDFSASQILCEINNVNLKPQKLTILPWAVLNFEFLDAFDILKCEIFPTIEIRSL